MTSQPSFQEYTRTLKSFYIKVMKGHSNMLKLSRNFMQIIEDISKADDGLRLSRISRKKSQISIAASKSKSIKSLRSLTQIRQSKPDNLFSSQQIKKTLLYSYLHHIISTSNTQIFNMIQTKSKLLIDSIPQNKITDRGRWERCVGEWKKIMQLMNHKNKVRWEKMMNIAIGGLQIGFVDVVLRAIFHSSGNLTGIFGDFQGNLEQIAGLLKISIYYEVHDKGEVLMKKVYGQFKNQIKIGYIKSDNTYIFLDKTDPQFQKSQKSQDIKTQSKPQLKPESNYLSISQQHPQSQSKQKQTNLQSPSPSSPSMNKNFSQIKSRTDIDNKSQKSISEKSKKRPTLPSSLLRKKNLRIVQALLKQFNSNTGKLMDLECFQNQESKDAKIKRILESRKKIQE